MTTATPRPQCTRKDSNPRSPRCKRGVFAAGRHACSNSVPATGIEPAQTGLKGRDPSSRAPPAWSVGVDSNHRPTSYKEGALAAELPTDGPRPASRTLRYRGIGSAPSPAGSTRMVVRGALESPSRRLQCRATPSQLTDRGAAGANRTRSSRVQGGARPFVLRRRG